MSSIKLRAICLRVIGLYSSPCIELHRVLLFDKESRDASNETKLSMTASSACLYNSHSFFYVPATFVTLYNLSKQCCVVLWRDILTCTYLRLSYNPLYGNTATVHNKNAVFQRRRH